MLGWALRCLGLAVLLGGVFVGLQDGGLFKQVLQRHGFVSPTKMVRPKTVNNETPGASNMLEEIIPGGRHGHFVANLYVNGISIPFLIDTGASHIVLKAGDAERLGFTEARLDYSARFQSANGTTLAAPISLRDMRLGQFQLHDMQAFVNQGALDISLLGMSFLRQFDSYEVVQDRLILRW
ncbi:MAG: retropepsin-like aspartic protease family protein [Geminicoccaceae bacterium]